MASTQDETKFVQQQEKYSLAEKKEFKELIEKYKEEYDQELGKQVYLQLQEKKACPNETKGNFFCCFKFMYFMQRSFTE